MSDGLTVAVTGPTGEIGRSFLRALDPHVDRILGMARRPFDPGALGLRNTEYRQGDILDPEAVHALVAEADVVVHLAFIILGGHDETRHDQPHRLAQRVQRRAPASASSTRRASPPTASTRTTRSR